MNTKLKRRLGVVTGVIVIVLVVVLAVVGGNASARAVSVAEALEMGDDVKVQVTGNVADNSFSIVDDVLYFAIYDPDADPAAKSMLPVSYDGGVSATFGNGVTAICTGKMNADGVLVCSELVTKCPSKYENAEGALTVGQLLEYGDVVIDKPVKVAGIIQEGTLAGIDAAVRFSIVDADGRAGVPVAYAGALPDDATEGAKVVLTGSIGKDGALAATNVALEG